MRQSQKTLEKYMGFLALIGLVLLVLLLAPTLRQISRPQILETAQSSTEDSPGLTLLEAYNMAIIEARKWQPDAVLYTLRSIEDEEAFIAAAEATSVVRGSQGRRASWNANFFSAETEDHLNVLIRNGKVSRTQPFDNPPPAFLIETPENLEIDSPRALELSQTQGLQPGQGPRVLSGYHFGLSRTEDGRPVVFVRGQDDLGLPTGVRIHATTGEIIDRQHRVTLDGGLFRKRVGQEWTALENPVFADGIFTLAVPSDEAETPQVYAGTVGSVVWSADGGDTWSVSEVGLPPGESVETIAFSPVFSTDGILFAGTDKGRVFLSKNAGRTWQPVDAGLSSDGWPIYSIVLSTTYSKDQTVYAGVYGTGVWKSTDGGRTWEAANTGLTDLRVRTITMVENRLYAGTDKGLFVSADKAHTWQHITELKDFHVNTIVAARGSRNTTLYVGLATEGVYHSVDEGNTWIKLGVDPRASAGSWTVASLAISPQNPQVLYSGGWRTGLAVSVNGGIEWLPVKLPAVTKPPAVAQRVQNVNTIVVLPDALQTVLVAAEPQWVWEPY